MDELYDHIRTIMEVARENDSLLWKMIADLDEIDCLNGDAVWRLVNLLGFEDVFNYASCDFICRCYIDILHQEGRWLL